MVTEEERREIINQAKEEILLALPDVIGNLITNHMELLKINKDFYTAHPELRDKKDIVASVVEMVEGNNPLEKYEEILKKALPEIKKRLDIVDSVDMDTVGMPNRDLNGVL